MPLMDHGLAGMRQLAVAAAFGGDIDDHRAGLHRARHFGGDQDRRFLAGHGGGGDHHVLLAHHFGQQFALASIELLAHRLGVSALVFGARCLRYSERRTSRPGFRSALSPRCARRRRRPPRPDRRAVAMACSPATPAPSMNTLAAVTVPAAVISIGNIFGSAVAASRTAR